MFGSPHRQTDLNKEILCPGMMWLIASDVSGDEVRTTRKVPVMSELSGLVHYRKMVKHSATLVQCLPNQNVPEALLQHTP